MTTPLLENILAQAEALRAVATYQFGSGRAALERAAELLRSRSRILLSGMGASYFACLPFGYSLARPGCDVVCTETAEWLYFGAAPLRDSAVVLVSRSGESVEVTKLLASFAESAPVVGVVNVAGSSLARGAKECLVLNSPADQFVAIQTYTATLAVFALLEAAIAGELARAQAELDHVIQVLENVLPHWVAAREVFHSFLAGATPLYLLGRGPSLGAVAEGVLLMHETAKSPAVGMSIPQFRHGPVEVVDSDFRGVVIGTQAATVDLDAALANDLVRMGGKVRWLGPDAPIEALCAWPENVPPRFAAIFETIPLQILAYAKAELRGLRPGDFRWAPLVTSSEAGFPDLVQK